MLDKAPLNDFSEVEHKFDEDVLEFLSLLMEEYLHTETANKVSTKD